MFHRTRHFVPSRRTDSQPDCRAIPYPTSHPLGQKLKPASQSYLHRDSQAAILVVIVGLALLLILAKFWLIHLLG